MHKKNNVTFLIFLLCICVNIEANTYYVSIDGSNLNSGSIASPLKSIQFAVNKANEGDSIILRSGIYYEQNIRINKSNIYLSNYQNEIVEIHNTIKINNLTNNITNFKSKINAKCIQLFCDGELQSTASFPDIIEGKMDKSNWLKSIANSDASIEIAGSSNFNSPSILVGLFGNELISISDTVFSTNGDLNFLNNSSWFWQNPSYINNGYAYLSDNLQFLNQPKEWFSDDSTLYYIPSFTDNINNHILEYRSSHYVIDISNSSNVIINGIHFFAGSANLKKSRSCQIKNSTFLYPTPFFTFENGFEKFSPNGINGYEDPETWNGNGPDWTKYDGPEKWHGNGVEVSGENNTIENCYIAHSWGDGLTVWGKGNKVINNVITDCNWIGMDCAALNISGSEHIIQFNELSHTGRSVLLHRFLENSKILNNHIHHGGYLCNDQGLTYTFWTDGKGTEIAYNYLHDNLGTRNHTGIYLDNWTYNFNVQHNIIENAGTGINLNKPNNNLTIYNNTLYNNFYSMGSWGPEGVQLKNVKTFNNLTNTDLKASWNYNSFYGTQMDSNYVYYENNIFQDPKNHGFQLKKYSYPIDKGILNEYTIEYNGILPDMGAIESETTPWKYGSTLHVSNEKYYKPKAPIDLKLVNNTPTITLFKWGYPFGLVDTFYIERKISTGNYIIIARLSANELTFDDANQSGGEYRYQIRAKNQYGISEPSNSIEIFNPFAKESLFLDAENNDIQYGTNINNDQLINNDNKDWIAYKHIDFNMYSIDACKIQYAVPCENAWQEVQIRLDNKMGRMIGKFTPLATESWNKFNIDSIPIEKTTGIHDVYIRFKGSYGVGTFDWFSLYNSEGRIKNKALFSVDSICPNPKSNSTKDIAIKLFPNPGSERLVVTFDNNEIAKATILVTNLNGKKVHESIYDNLNLGTIEIYLEDNSFYEQVEKGLYLVKVNIESKHHNQETTLKYVRL